MGAWNWLDYILAAIVVLSILRAMMRGFVRELISLAAVVVGLGVAAFGYPRAALWFDDLTKSHEIALGLGFLVLFIGTLIVGAVIGAIASKLIKSAGIQSFDRLLGALFGLVRGVLVDAILLMAMVAFAIKPNVVRQSTLAPYITTGTRVIAAVMPGELRTQFRQGFLKLRQQLTETDKGAVKPPTGSNENSY